MIDEYSDIGGRHVFGQDNKGWKAVSNAVKGRLVPDDDQYTLNVALLSQLSGENVCHITLLEQRDAADFFSLRAGEHGLGCLCDGLWPYRVELQTWSSRRRRNKRTGPIISGVP